MNPVNTMKWLIRRELWEHKGMLVRAPLILAAVLVLFSAVSMVNLFARGTFELDVHGKSIAMSGDSFSVAVGGHNHAMISHALNNYMGAAVPLFMMMAVVVFSYCIGALYNERRDRSLLFWKSLPVSDTATVLSKALLALVVAPLITLAIGALTALLLILMAAAVIAIHGLDLFGIVFTTPSLYLAPLKILALLPVAILWALPTVGWLLMVSAWARSKVFLWAVGMPLLVGVLVIWSNHLFNLDIDGLWFFEHIVGHLLLGVAPGCWLLFERAGLQITVPDDGQHIGFGDVFTQSWATLAMPAVWIGAVAGIAMLAAAIWLRRRRDES
jgi:ABC-2 type transport system permease protein